MLEQMFVNDEKINLKSEQELFKEYEGKHLLRRPGSMSIFEHRLTNLPCECRVIETS